MAHAIIGGQYALTASAASITTALGLSVGVYVKKLTIKNAGAAVNKVYVGDSDVTTSTNAHIELSADQSYEYWSGESHRVNTDDVYVIGTVNAANILYINGIT